MSEWINGKRLTLPEAYKDRRNLTLAFRSGFMAGVHESIQQCPRWMYASNPPMRAAYVAGFDAARAAEVEQL